MHRPNDHSHWIDRFIAPIYRDVRVGTVNYGKRGASLASTLFDNARVLEQLAFNVEHVAQRPMTDPFTKRRRPSLCGFANNILAWSVPIPGLD